MQLLSEKQALRKLAAMQDDFSRIVRRDYEDKAESCLTCQTPGACCLDAHFVNVHISRLEAAAIKARIETFGDDLRHKVLAIIESTIRDYDLIATGDTYAQKFACPLFEKGTGCLVHDDGKPVACTVHACYDNQEDLPPDEIQTAQELNIDDLNARTYDRREPWLPLPLALARPTLIRPSQTPAGNRHWKQQKNE